MKRVAGIGGVFFKAANPEKLYTWYEKHLGLKRERKAGAVLFHWRHVTPGDKRGFTVWSLFPQDTKYFDPSPAGFMINYRVEDLDGLLRVLRKEGVEIAGHEAYQYGKFAWIMDPEGNRIELWEPAEAKPTSKKRGQRKARRK